MLNTVSRVLGVPADQLVALSAMLCGYPISIFFNFLFDGRTPTEGVQSSKHLFSVLACSLVMLAFFDLYGWLNLVGISILSWIISKIMPRRKVGIVTMITVLLHLAANHLSKQLNTKLDGQKKFDYTAALMVLTIKLTSYGFSVSDGALPDDKLLPSQRTKVIRRIPSLLEFMGFTFHWAGFLAGPAFDYALYRKWVDQSLFIEHSDSKEPKSNQPDSKSNESKQPKPARRPQTLLPTLRTLAFGLFFAILYSLVGKHGYHSLLASTESSFFRRLLLINLAGLASRTKFYAAWKIAEGACIAVGLGYTPASSTRPASHGRLTNVNPINIELAQSIKEYADNWNINTQSWLRFAIHERAHSVGVPVGWEILAVFGTSSFWHGFYPGYYLTFLSLALFLPLSRTLRRTLRTLFIAPSKLAPYKPLYDATGWLATQLCINYAVAPFMLLELPKSLKIWSGVHYFMHICGVVAFIVLKMGGERAIRELGKAVGVPHEPRVGIAEVKKKI